MAHIAKSRKSTHYIILALILLFGLVLRLAVFSGITGGDDMIYTYDIYKYSIGNFTPGTSHWSLRLGFILPIALFVRIFGFNEVVLAIFPLICSIVNILLIYALGKLVFNERIGLYAAFFLSFFPLEVFFATMVFVDIPITLFMGFVVFYFLKSERYNKSRYYLLSGCFLGLAYLTRLTGLYILLFPLAYIIIEKKFKLQYGLILLAFLSIVFLEMGYYTVKTGNPLYRFAIITKTHHRKGQRALTQKVGGQEGEFFKGQDLEKITVLRGNNWFLEPVFTFTTNQEFGFFYYFIIPITIYSLMKKDKNVKILLIWLIPLGLYILYGTTSPFRFSPLRRWPRYLSPLTFPALLMLAYFLEDKKGWLWKKFSLFTTGFLCVTSLLFIFAFNDGPTDSYIVKNIAAFSQQHRQKDILLYWSMYQHLAPFLKYQKDLNIKLYGFPEDRLRPEGSFYYGIELADPDAAKDCYIVIPPANYDVSPQKDHPNWELTQSIVRPGKFYCPLVDRTSFIPGGIKEILCPHEVSEIYYIPDV